MTPGIFIYLFFFRAGGEKEDEEEVAAAIDRLAFRDNNQGG